MQIKDNQINIIRIKLDSNIVSEFYHPDIITKSVKTATKGKSLPIEIWSEVTDQKLVNFVTSQRYDAIRYNLPTLLVEVRNSGGRTYLVTQGGKK